MDTGQSDYCSQNLPPDVLEKLQAGAFRSLCQHLQERSDPVQNMDLMTLSGFCRNCLAKWMVLEARELTDEGAVDDATKQALDALGYEEAAQHVYGTTYAEWKKRHQKPATEEKLERFNASKELHAKHDNELLATRARPPTTVAQSSTARNKAKPTESASSELLSNVCCQDVDPLAPVQDTTSPVGPLTSKSRTIAPFQPPPLPKLSAQLRLGVLTVSDRAFHKEYVTGDLSGPAVIEAVKHVLQQTGSDVVLADTAAVIVPDEFEAIQSQLKAWSDIDCLDVILTTGGTGLSPRDVTPEATRSILDQECSCLMAFVTVECSHVQPLASLSRGTAGFRGKTMICNLPGNPKGVTEVVPILLPVLLHAVVDLQ